MSRRKRSFLTATDQFCGAGGSTIGAVKAGLEVRLALNHWPLAIETHNTNFPETDHDCTDVSAADPRRYPSTDILITSPECTTHSPAGGSRRSKPQSDLFKPHQADPGEIRSRATMWDVPRFAEYHQYNAVIVENVIEVTRWPLFHTWLQAMEVLGYQHRIVSLNSMFCHPTPQSRDRVYIVFWRKGNRAPQLDFMPSAACLKCETVVRAIQAWKNGRRVGKYRQQYVYACPTCGTEVSPFYFAALNAIDFSLPADRIGDRVRPLRPRTMERIRFGLEKFGRLSLIVRTNMTTDGGRVKTVLDAMHTQTASWLDSVVSPPAFVVETVYTGRDDHPPRGLEDALAAQTGRQSAALVGAPFLVAVANGGGDRRRVVGMDDPLRTVHAGGNNHALVMPFVVNGHMSRRVYGGADPLGTQSASRVHDGVVIPPAGIVPQRNHNVSRSLADPLHVVCTGGHHMLVSGAALVTLRSEGQIARGLGDALGTQVASCTQDWILSRTPFVMTPNRTGHPVSADGPIPTVTTIDRNALVEPGTEPRVEDCYFRMLQPHEIKAAMAFPDSYVVLGNKRDQVKQCGNAVTPPAMEFLIRAVTESLAA